MIPIKPDTVRSLTELPSPQDLMKGSESDTVKSLSQLPDPNKIISSNIDGNGEQKLANADKKDNTAQIDSAIVGIQNQLSDLQQQKKKIETSGDTTGAYDIYKKEADLNQKLDQLKSYKVNRVHNFINQFAKSLMKGTYGTASTIGNLLVGNSLLGPQLGAVMAQSAAHTIKKQADHLFPTNKKLKDEFISSKVPEFMGNIAPLMIAPEIMAGEGAGIGLSALATGITFALPDAGASFVQAMDQTGNAKKAYESMLTHGLVSGAGGAILGGGDSIVGKGITKGLRAIDDATDGAISSAMKKGMVGRAMKKAYKIFTNDADGSIKAAALKTLGEGTKNSIELGLLGAGQKIADNFTSNDIYKLAKKVNLFKGTGQAFEKGLVTGVILHGVGMGFKGLQNLVHENIYKKGSPIDPDQIDPVKVTSDNYEKAQQEYRDLVIGIGSPLSETKAGSRAESDFLRKKDIVKATKRMIGLKKGIDEYEYAQQWKMDNSNSQPGSSEAQNKLPVKGLYKGKEVTINGKNPNGGVDITTPEGETITVQPHELSDIHKVGSEKGNEPQKDLRPIQLTVGEDNKKGSVTMVPQKDGSYEITEYTLSTNHGPKTTSVNKMSFSEANKIAEKIRNELAGRMANHKQNVDVKVAPSNPADPYSSLQIFVIPSNGESVKNATKTENAQKSEQSTSGSEEQQSEKPGATNKETQKEPTQKETKKPAESTPKEKQPGKEPWQMTQDEWAIQKAKQPNEKQKDVSEADRKAIFINSGLHKKAVEKALKEGKPVPEKVLKDYPGLSKQSSETQKETKKPAAAIPVWKQNPIEAAKTFDKLHKKVVDDTATDAEYEQYQQQEQQLHHKAGPVLPVYDEWKKNGKYKELSKIPKMDRIAFSIYEKIKDGSYQKAIQNGEMKPDEVKKIITDAGLTVPDNLEKKSSGTPKKETSQEYGYVIYPQKFKRDGKIVEGYAIQSEDNKKKSVIDGFGNTIVDTYKQAKEEAKWQKKQKEQEEKNKIKAEKQKEVAKKQETDRLNSWGFADNLPDLKKGKVLKTLNRTASFNGKVGRRKDLIKKMVENGYHIEEKKIDGKTQRVLAAPDGGFLDEKQITKTGMDFAEYIQMNPDHGKTEKNQISGKMTHEMSLPEFRDYYNKLRNEQHLKPEENDNEIQKLRKEIIIQAKIDGKNIPESILKEFPGIQKSSIEDLKYNKLSEEAKNKLKRLKHAPKSNYKLSIDVHDLKSKRAFDELVDAGFAVKGKHEKGFQEYQLRGVDPIPNEEEKPQELTVQQKEAKKFFEAELPKRISDLPNKFDEEDLPPGELNVKPKNTTKPSGKGLTPFKNIVSKDKSQPVLHYVLEDPDLKLRIATDGMSFIALEDESIKKRKLLDPKTGKEVKDHDKYPDIDFLTKKPETKLFSGIDLKKLSEDLKGLERANKFTKNKVYILARVAGKDQQRLVRPHILKPVVDALRSQGIKKADIYTHQSGNHPAVYIIDPNNRYNFGIAMPVVTSTKYTFKTVIGNPNTEYKVQFDNASMNEPSEAGKDTRKQLSETKSKPKSSPRAKEIGDHLRALVKDWKQSDNIIIADSVFELPADIRDLLFREFGLIRGLYHNGKSYVFTWNMRSPEEAQETLLHEAIGHMGIRGLINLVSQDRAQFDHRLKRLANEVYRSFHKTKEFKDIVKTYHLDMSKADDRQEAGEEFIAHLAQMDPKASILDKVMKFIRDILKKLGIQLKLGRDQLIKLIQDARQFVEGDSSVVDGNNDIRSVYQKTPLADVFYSKLEQTVDENLPNKGTPDQFIQTLDSWQGKGKFKKEELEWSGVKDWLEEQDSPVTKTQVMNYLRDNELELQETKHQDIPVPQEFKDYIKQQPIDNLTFPNGPRTQEDWIFFADVLNKRANNLLSIGDKEEAKKVFDLHDKAVQIAEGVNPETGSTQGTAHYGDYTLPGGKNYKEILIHLPDIEKTDFEQLNKKWENWSKKIAKKYDTTDLSFLYDHGDLTKEETQQYSDFINRYDQLNNELYKTFISRHFNERNIIAHTRIKDRQDRAGNKVLFIEEIQSDWHQAGREKGYLPKTAPKVHTYHPNDLKVTETEFQYKTKDIRGKEIGVGKMVASNLEDAKKYLAKVLNDKEKEYIRSLWEQNMYKVPEAPFKTTWPELIFKRMIRHAAENGYDKIGWTTGEQQAKRYDLSKQISQIGYSKTDLKAWDHNGTLIISKTGITPDLLPDYIGKEVAQKLLNQPSIGGDLQMLEGQDISVGGEGMKTFYDKMLANYVKKYTKKWGSDVLKEDISTKEDKYQKAWTVNITPKMAKEVLEIGQPLFHKSVSDKINEDNVNNTDIRFHKTDSGTGPLSDSWDRDNPDYSEEDGKADESSKNADPNSILSDEEYPNFVKAFWIHDLQPFLDALGATTKGSYDFFRDLAFPTVGVDKETQALIRKHLLGERNQKETEIDGFVEGLEKMFRRLPDKHRIAFIDRMMQGKKQPTKEIQKAADILHGLFDELFYQLSQYNPGLSYRQHYFGLMWKSGPKKDIEGNFILKHFKQSFSNRPLEGTKSWTKEKIFEDMTTGIKLGYTPTTTNPVSLLKLLYSNGMKYITAQRLWEKMKKEGLAKFVRHDQHAPDRFTRLDDRIAKVYFPVKDRGEFWVEEGAARLLNNFLGIDHFRNGKARAIGKPLIYLKNFYTAVEVGYSPFHAVFESIEAIGSQLALGTRKILNIAAHKDMNLVLDGLKDVITSPYAFRSLRNIGKEAIKYAKHPELLNQPEAKSFLQQFPDAYRLITDGFNAGMKLSMPEIYRLKTVQSFQDSWANHDWAGAALKFLPGFQELIMHPLFEHYIPRLKLGLFLKEYSSLLVENHYRLEKGYITRDELANKAWRFVEQRMGEMNFDTLFWNRTFKTANQLTWLSVTWKLGDIGAFGEAPFEQAAEFYHAIRERRAPMLMPKFTWAVFGLAATQAVLATLVQLLMTGQWPNTVKDLISPRVDKNDPDIRIIIPTYIKDLVHAYHSPSQFVESSLSGLFRKVVNVWNNKDFYGYEIYNPKLNGLSGDYEKTLQIMRYMIPRPFVLSSWQAMARSNEPMSRRMTGFFGFTKAPGYLTHTPIQNEIFDLYRLHVAHLKPYAARKTNNIKKQIRQAYKSGHPALAESIADKAIKDGTLRMTQYKYLLRNRKKDEDPSAFMWRELPFADKMYLWPKMTGAQKLKYDPKGNFKNKYINQKIAEHRSK